MAERVVHHVVASLEPGGGPSYTVPALSEALRHCGWQSDIYTQKWPRSSTTTDDAVFFSTTRKSVPSVSMGRALLRAADAGDVVHLHGLWLWPSLMTALLPLLVRRTRLVVSPRGMMSDWAWGYKRSKKAVVWQVAQRHILRASAFHATSEGEQQEIRSRGYRGPVAIIPNGVDMPDTVPERSGRSSRTLLYLGRLHPKKGLDLLLRAWTSIAPSFPNWKLRIVGLDEEGTAAELGRFIREYAVERVTVEGPSYGEDKARAFSEADAFVLPTRSENFGLAVAEALSYGLPCVVTKGAPWRNIESHRCGYWVDVSERGVESGLRRLLELDNAEMQQHSARARELAREYAWLRVAEQMSELYEQVQQVMESHA